MASVQESGTKFRRAFALPRGITRPYRQFARALARLMPKGLFLRSLLIIVTPMLLLQSVVAFVFMERHWDLVTRRLSEAVTRDIAAIISILETYPQDEAYRTISNLASNELGLSITILPPGPLPKPAPKPFFNLLDRTLSSEITKRVGKPFWIDTVGRSRLVEVRIQLEGKVLRVLAKRSKTYASNSHIFIVWMVAASLVLLTVAIIFLRNQIRPIQRLAQAAESFGKGHETGPFQPSGATEVRKASEAFIQMRRRIERQIEQRTTMLAGVSHDLRTVLTRFRLQLALIGDNPGSDALNKDVEEMQAMLQTYLDFARGDIDELARPIDIPVFLNELVVEADVAGKDVSFKFDGEPSVVVKPQALKRCVTNLIVNAYRHGTDVKLSASHRYKWLTIQVDDDGRGIAESERENVFRPFYRLDAARNQDQGGTGLGLTIARDIARGHGGDIQLSTSPSGGLRAIVRIPG
jgi:two-component system osmolarity sensor histidine kinase EnvZ